MTVGELKAFLKTVPNGYKIILHDHYFQEDKELSTANLEVHEDLKEVEIR